MTTLPSIITLSHAAAELVRVAHDADDRAAENAINKAIYHLETGIQVVPTTGGYLVPSGTRAGVIHRVSETHGCNCEAAQAGRQCWHQAAVEIIEAAHVTEPISYQGVTAAYASRPKGADGYALDDLYPPR